MGTNSFSQQGYGLATPIYNVQQPPIISLIRGPTVDDQAQLGTLWIWNKGTTSQAWVLGSIVNNTAFWIPVGGSSALTVEANDATTAVPNAMGVLNVFGLHADGLTTTASGNTLTIETLALQRPAFLAYQPASTGNVTGAGTQYILGNDSNGGFNVFFDNAAGLSGTGGSATLTYTVPQTGIWMLTLSISYTSGTAYQPGDIRITTTNASFIDDTGNAVNVSGGSGSDNMSVVTPLTAGDTITYSCSVNGQGGDTTAILGSVLPFHTFVSGAIIS